MSNKINTALDAETAEAIESAIKFPVQFNSYWGKIYDSRNFEVATVKHFQTDEAIKRQIGDWMAEVLNEAWRERNQDR